MQRRRLVPAAFLLAQFRERKSRATFAGIACCADHTPVQRCRPAPAAYAARPRRREAKPNCRERKDARKSRATFAGIACCADHTPVQRCRPAPAAYAARPRRREAKPNCRERKDARKSRATFAGIACCADHTPVQRCRPAPAAYAARPRRREAKPNCRERKNARSGPPPHNDRVGGRVRPLSPGALPLSPVTRSEGSLEWCRACWRVTKILHLWFRMTGYFASQ